MIKGAQKQMIVLRTANSRYFDEAYFVLRKEVEPKRCRHSDMLTEANRILQESAAHAEPKRRDWHPRIWLPFVAGALCGGGVAALLFLLLI